MKKIVILKYLLFFSSFVILDIFSNPTINIFGDSHASFCFRERAILEGYDMLNFFHQSTQKTIPLIITSFIGVTMHRVGREGLGFLNIRHHRVKEGDVAVYIFGEVDVRCHIGKQRDQSKRTLDEVINTLATNYINTISQNSRQFNKLITVVASVIPPIEGEGRTSPDYPFYGTLQDRTQVTQKLNSQLKELCTENNFLFLDIYSLFCNSQGSLNSDYADHAVHINHIHNKTIKNALIDLIIG